MQVAKESPNLHYIGMHDHHNEPETWLSFCALNWRRRAIRDFDGSAIADADIKAVLEQALLAPSSGNLQPYELHWIGDPELKLRVAEACEAQRAARQRGDPDRGGDERRNRRAHRRRTLRYVEHEGALNADAKRYHMEQLTKFRRFLHIAPLLLWAPLRWLLALFDPVYALVPIGPSGVSHWTARSGIYAAQTLLLAASARGIDSCPMEGFNPRRVARALGLPRGSVIPIVIALGRRRADARIEPRWRRALAAAVVPLRAHFMNPRARIWVEAVSAARRGTEGILPVSRGFATQQTRPDRLKGAAGVYEMRSDERGPTAPGA